MPRPVKPAIPTPIADDHTYKGCVHWYEFVCNQAASTMNDIHPCIIIGKRNSKSPRVIISPISGAEHYVNERGELKYPLFQVLLKKADHPFLNKDSVVLLDQVFTIPKDDLSEEWYMGKLKNVRKLDEAIMNNYDLIDTIRQIIDEIVDAKLKEAVGIS
jgi:mRNA-degrading endonuclease toxin of MazEF toxin-antitoxin module